ncbi:uncharacterized protein LOC110110614 [Dendrobium catenatum]|uniref:uncharacterized protein LOC110110614 n=1 Tax=Dendrobium catenatum TaxID=906689 RepID=UPI0009F6DE9C|nr:uncharacterized protein LOC110110614 [Dendrobium catenatum]
MPWIRPVAHPLLSEPWAHGGFLFGMQSSFRWKTKWSSPSWRFLNIRYGEIPAACTERWSFALNILRADKALVVNFLPKLVKAIAGRCLFVYSLFSFDLNYALSLPASIFAYQLFSS